MKIPERTCIVCRKKREKSSLLRIIRSDAGIETDFTGNRNGRGAYVCRNKACISRLSAKALNHALKTKLNVNKITDIIRIDDMDF